jgi:hypothetical protein
MIPNGPKIYQHFPLRGRPKSTRIGIFGLKICHLATLAEKAAASSSAPRGFFAIRRVFFYFFLCVLLRLPRKKHTKLK